MRLINAMSRSTRHTCKNFVKDKEELNEKNIKLTVPALE